MDEPWLTSLDQSTCILVPTRSLQSSLNKQFAQAQLNAGKTVWPAANILTWHDYLTHLWSANQTKITHGVALIDQAQVRLLWERVIQKTKREHDELILLNVPQTARAALRSWNLAHDWQIGLEEIQCSKIEDTRQFGLWCRAYLDELQKHHFLDVATLYHALLALLSKQNLHTPFSQVIWYGFDLITAAQQEWQNRSAAQSIQHHTHALAAQEPEFTHSHYANQRDEYASVLRRARELLEENDALRIHIVVPNLQAHQEQLQALAGDVFHPSDPPLTLLENDLVYRFSLGKPVADWTAITAAMRALKLLKSTLSAQDLAWLWRNPFFHGTHELKAEIAHFETWLNSARLSHLQFDDLPQLLSDSGLQTNSPLQDFVAQLLSFKQELNQEINDNSPETRYRTLRLARWRDLFTQWLALWGWSTTAKNSQLSSVQYQLLERWQQTLAKFESLNLVQTQAGLSRALELLLQTAKEEIFLPKAADTPITISGVFEALGMPCDVCFITGMNEQYPASLRPDPFLANELRDSALYPSANPTRHLEQAKKVVKSLSGSSEVCHVSYAIHDTQDAAIKVGVSSLFRHQKFAPCGPAPVNLNLDLNLNTVTLEQFTDQRGPALTNTKDLRGGTSIFTDQSNCAFRAFARHRLGCSSDTEAEFGLDSLDRGNFVHFLLEQCWQSLQSQAELVTLIASDGLTQFVEKTVSAAITAFAPKLSEQKSKLIHLEQQRLQALLSGWLILESKRPSSFFVASIEEQDTHEVGGIPFRYKIDRTDLLEDGRTVILDYKTGTVRRADLTGERLRQPQLPLYVQALNSKKHSPPAGIALAQVKQHDSNFTELSEAGIFARSPSYAEGFAQTWADACEQWPVQLESLAAEFLQGDARVNPIDQTTCQYCDLHALCRINQLQGQHEVENGE